MSGWAARDGATKHPLPDEPVEERVRGKRLGLETTREKKECRTEARRLSHEFLQTFATTLLGAASKQPPNHCASAGLIH